MEEAHRREQPLVSIITPSLNQGGFIEETILSVRNQTYPNIEHIICDAGSTDGTPDVIRKHEGTYNLRWVSEPDNGQADAINKGFDMAQGEIVTWLNSDDIYLTTEAVSRVVSIFRAYPTADVVTGDGVQIDDDGRWVRPFGRWKTNRVCYKHLRYANPLVQPSTFFRRHVLQECRCDTTFYYAFDWDLFIRIARRYNLLPIHDMLSGFRIHRRAKTAAIGTAYVGEQREIIRRYLGPRSPQHLMFVCYHVLFKASDLLPRPLRIALQWTVERFSVAISTLTFGRICAV